MDTDDLEPPQPKLAAVKLEEMSIEAIGEYIAGLEAEIARARAAIAFKGDARSVAESVFK